MIDIIKKSQLFNKFTDEELALILKESNARKEEHKKYSYIFSQGQVPKYLYLLISGRVQVEKLDINGKRTIVNIFKEASTVFGEVYLYLNQAYDYSCLALEDTLLLAMPKEYFLGDNKSPSQEKLRDNMLEILAHKAFYLNQKLIVLSSYSLRQKLSNYLLLFSKKSERVELEFNREELADYLGTTRPSLSRELMNMEADGLIKVDKNIILIDDLEKLKDLT